MPGVGRLPSRFLLQAAARRRGGVATGMESRALDGVGSRAHLGGLAGTRAVGRAATGERRGHGVPRSRRCRVPRSLRWVSWDLSRRAGDGGRRRAIGDCPRPVGPPSPPDLPQPLSEELAYTAFPHASEISPSPSIDAHRLHVSRVVGC